MNGFEFPVEVVRSDRKRSVSIQLEGVGIKIRVPKTLSERRVREMIVRKSAWIKQKINEAELVQPIKPKEYVSGESFPYLGENYPLKVVTGDSSSVELKDGYFGACVAKHHADPQATIASLLANWYRENAVKCLAEKTTRFAKVIGVTPQSVTVKSYQSRWGSCSVRGDISYNWRIILAPHRIIDYVVVHELCHLLEHNHSSRYWQHVECYIADYRERRSWLKTASNQLHI